MDNNAYLVTCSHTGETLLIDAANDAEILLELIERHGPEAVADRHQPPAPGPLAGAGGGRQGHRRADRRAPSSTPNRCRSSRTALLADGDTVKIGELSFDVIHLQGHTPGSVALALRRRSGRSHAPVHRRLPVPRRCWQDMARPASSTRCSAT